MKVKWKEGACVVESDIALLGLPLTLIIATAGFAKKVSAQCSSPGWISRWNSSNGLAESPPNMPRPSMSGEAFAGHVAALSASVTKGIPNT